MRPNVLHARDFMFVSPLLPEQKPASALVANVWHCKYQMLITDLSTLAARVCR